MLFLSSIPPRLYVVARTVVVEVYMLCIDDGAHYIEILFYHVWVVEKNNPFIQTLYILQISSAPCSTCGLPQIAPVSFFKKVLQAAS